MSLAARITRTVPRSVRQERPGDDKRHLEVIRGLPCVIPGCGSQTSEPHHLLRVHDGAPKGVGRKNEDRWAVPVCRTHHEAAHAAGNDEAWFAGQNIQARDLAEALFATRRKDNYAEAALRVVLRHKQKGA